MRNRKIYEKDPLYSFLRPIVDWNVRHSYRKVQVQGEENLPKDGPFIIAPNHCNTLMDALVILRAHKGPTVFGARADMFKMPLIAKIMYFLRILPMVRQRDGLRNVLKNVETQDVIVETLENDVRFCIFPEGRHRAEKSMLPLGKGVFRAALAANDRFGKTKPVYIVPTGLEYGDFFRYRSTALVTFGKPLNITEFVKGLGVENEAQMIEPLRKELASRMSELFTFLKDDEHLQEKWELVKMLSISSDRKPYGNYGTRLSDDMMHNRRIAAAVDKALEEKPEEMKRILKEVSIFKDYRKKDRISIYSFHKSDTFMQKAGKCLAALIGLLFFIFSAIASLPMWLAEVIIRGKVKDKAFKNTVSFGIKLGLGLIWFIAWTTLAFCLTSWPIALALTLLFIPSYSYVHDYTEGMRRLISDIKISKCKKLRKRFKAIINEFNNL